MKLLNAILFVGLVFGISTQSFARSSGGGSGGGHSIGVGVGLATASQSDLDTLANSVNTTSGRNSATMGSGLEFTALYQYRFSGSMFALVLAPSYFSQSGKGTTDQTKLTGYTIFPMMRLYPLENTFIHFYMQAGLGYGSLTGTITQPSASITFSGSAFGAAGGLGAEFCFTDSHCAYVEGNYRYLPIQRNLVTTSNVSSSGTITQSGSGSELELSSNDLSTSMSGIVGSIGYMMNF